MPSVLENDEIREYIREKAGDLGLSMCQLIEQGVVIIADLAEVMAMPRRATRQVLYQLNKERIVGYKRTRAGRRIVFHWFITQKKILRMISAGRKKEIRELEEALEYEQDHKFFECVPCGERYLYTEAFEFDFQCEHCGTPLEAQDNNQRITDLRARLEKLVQEEDLSAKDLDEAPEAVAVALDGEVEEVDHIPADDDEEDDEKDGEDGDDEDESGFGRPRGKKALDDEEEEKVLRYSDPEDEEDD